MLGKRFRFGPCCGETSIWKAYLFCARLVGSAQIPYSPPVRGRATLVVTIYLIQNPSFAILFGKFLNNFAEMNLVRRMLARCNDRDELPRGGGQVRLSYWNYFTWEGMGSRCCKDACKMVRLLWNRRLCKGDGDLGPEKVEAKEEWRLPAYWCKLMHAFTSICISTLISCYANMCFGSWRKPIALEWVHIIRYGKGAQWVGDGNQAR